MAISSVAQLPITSSHVPSTSTNTFDIDTIECIIQPRNFLFLIPTITGIALGILFLPNFGLVLCKLNFCGFGYVKAPGLNDRKASCIELIQRALRSLNRGSFHVSPNCKN